MLDWGLGEAAYGTTMWNETLALEDATLRRETRFPRCASEWIVQGPHFYVGNPLNKTPREGCRHNQDYDVIDLEAIPDDYLPRTNYVPACSDDEYRLRTPRHRGQLVTASYRHAHREMLALTGERTFVPVILAPGVGHVNTVVSFTFPTLLELAVASGFFSSLVADYFVRAKGSGHLQAGQSRTLPLPREDSPYRASIAARALRLQRVTDAYADLWNEVWPKLAGAAPWSSDDPRLTAWPAKDSTWSRASACRNHFERRWLLVELDVFSALELGLTMDELCTLYRTQFPVMRDYEQNTWYDQSGRIVFTTNRGLPGVGQDRKAFEASQGAPAVGAEPRVEAEVGHSTPFRTRDRETDIRRAHTRFL